MYPHRLTAYVLFVILGWLPVTDLYAQITLTRGGQLGIDVAVDGRIAMDLRGDLWIVGSSGGDATQLTRNLQSVQHPRWSPDAARIAYLGADGAAQAIWVFDLEQDEAVAIGATGGVTLYPQWHPDGERLIYASVTASSGFDLWEVDVETGLKWRITRQPGDETGGSWSADGRDLVYVAKSGNQWSLILRRHGQREETLATSTQKIAAPSWRPDGSLITYYQYQNNRPVLKMAILSTPRLIRTYADNENFAGLPIRWRDRGQMYFVANGEIRQRQFDDWKSRPLPFRATVYPPPDTRRTTPRPELQWHDEPAGEWIIKSARLFDGVSSHYRYDLDILIRGGRIAALEQHRNRPGSIVIDMGDLTIIPGIIDVDARLPANLSAAHGPDILAMGVTTVVSLADDGDALTRLWSGKTIPGPRLLDRNTWGAGPLSPPEFDVTGAVSSSAATGQNAGVALSTQLRSLQHAGLSAEQSLRALSVNAAGAIRADPYLGRIAIGSVADLVFVDGDPLDDSAAVLNVVAVVRNGRFYSVSGLFDRAKAAENVD